MGKGLTHGDLRLAIRTELRPVSRNRRLVVELTAIDKPGEYDGRRPFRRRPDIYQGIGCPGRCALRYPVTTGQRHDLLATVIDDETGAGLPVVISSLEIGGEDLANRFESPAYSTLDCHTDVLAQGPQIKRHAPGPGRPVGPAAVADAVIEGMQEIFLIAEVLAPECNFPAIVDIPQRDPRAPDRKVVCGQ